MPLVSPEEIAVKAENAYPRFLKKWIHGEHDDFFPYRVRVRLVVDPKNVRGTITASERLLSKSKPYRGWGYTVRRDQVRMRDFGTNPVPKAITIDTLDDLLRLAKKSDEFTATCLVVDRIRTEFPQLNDWLLSHVQSLNGIAETINGLILVSQYFTEPTHGRTAMRGKIPVPVDTKFIERHKTTLRQWLDVLFARIRHRRSTNRISIKGLGFAMVSHIELSGCSIRNFFKS